MLQLRGKWNYPFGTFKPFLYMTTTQQIVDPLKQLYSVYLHTVAGKHTKWQRHCILIEWVTITRSQKNFKNGSYFRKIIVSICHKGSLKKWSQSVTNKV